MLISTPRAPPTSSVEAVGFAGHFEANRFHVRVDRRRERSLDAVNETVFHGCRVVGSGGHRAGGDTHDPRAAALLELQRVKVVVGVEQPDPDSPASFVMLLTAAKSAEPVPRRRTVACMETTSRP